MRLSQRKGFYGQKNTDEQKLKGKSNEIIITYCIGACLCYGRTVYSIQAQPTCSHTRENLADVRHSGE